MTVPLKRNGSAIDIENMIDTAVDGEFDRYPALSQSPNQRRHPRNPSYVIADYRVAEGKFCDIIQNISAGGLSILTDRQINAGQPITIEFPLFQFDYTVQVSGRVVRRDPDGIAVAFDDPISGLTCKDGLLPEILKESEPEGPV